MSNPNEIYVVYRLNKGYFYGPGAPAKLVGKAINWGVGVYPYLAEETTEEKVKNEKATV